MRYGLGAIRQTRNANFEEIELMPDTLLPSIKLAGAAIYFFTDRAEAQLFDKECGRTLSSPCYIATGIRPIEMRLER